MLSSCWYLVHIVTVVHLTEATTQEPFCHIQDLKTQGKIIYVKKKLLIGGKNVSRINYKSEAFILCLCV